MSLGIHHVTAIAGNAGRNLAFYARTLGMRLVKKTVNFDDPGTYHLYYGDAAGAPGTIMTFFPWDRAAPGRPGAGELLEAAFRMPLGAMGFWEDRLQAFGAARGERFGEALLTFTDPDGMRLALAGLPGIEAEPAWHAPGIPPEAALRGVHGVTLALAATEPTAAVLDDVFGFAAAGRDGAATRHRAPGVAVGGIVDLLATGGPPARQGRGSVHHLAFRAADDAAQSAMADKLLAQHGLHPTEQKDRDYFRSIYFREPGGVLFEIATDAPGFAVDEPADALGTSLKLPRALQPHRAAIEAALPALG